MTQLKEKLKIISDFLILSQGLYLLQVKPEQVKMISFLPPLLKSALMVNMLELFIAEIISSAFSRDTPIEPSLFVKEDVNGSLLSNFKLTLLPLKSAC